LSDKSLVRKLACASYFVEELSFVVFFLIGWLGLVVGACLVIADCLGLMLHGAVISQEVLTVLFSPLFGQSPGGITSMQGLVVAMAAGPVMCILSVLWLILARYIAKRRGAVFQRELAGLRERPIPQGLSAEDQEKINLEVNQILNQRFLIATAALTLFGGFCALGLQFRPRPERTEIFYLGFTGLLILLLQMLYLQSFFLRRLHRTYGTYLRLTGGSRWEVDFDRFRRFGYFAYTKSETVLYVSIQFLGSFMPLLFSWIDGRTPDLIAATSAVIAFGVVSSFVMYGMGFYGWLANDIEAEIKWRKALS
jgi:hypothetical protein